MSIDTGHRERKKEKRQAVGQEYLLEIQQ